MTINSLQQIRDEFQIETHDPVEILEKLKSIRNEVHPDRSNGSFKSSEDKELYHKADSAISFIEKMDGNTQLLVVEQVAQLVRVVKELIPSQNQNSVQQRLESRLDYRVAHFRSPLFFPKVSLTAVTGIISFIALFPGQAADNPVLHNRLDLTSRTFFAFWIMMLFVTAGFWMLTYLIEEKSKRRMERLKMESEQNRIFLAFVMEQEEFEKDDLTHFILSERLRYSAIFVGPTDPMVVDVAQSLADAIIVRAVNNGVIAKIHGSGMSDRYELKAKSTKDFR